MQALNQNLQRNLIFPITWNPSTAFDRVPLPVILDASRTAALTMNQRNLSKLIRVPNRPKYLRA